MAKIIDVRAREILDSRGTPTIETEIKLDDGISARGSAPSGVSIGSYEALELRDNDPSRRMGLGVLKAVANVNSVIKQKILDLDPSEQKQIDETLLTLDGTSDKSKLGANTLISVSQAVASAAAKSKKIFLYKYLSSLAQLSGISTEAMRIPTPVFNMINGGKHGYGNVEFQEFQIIPNAQKSYSDALSIGIEIYQNLGKLLTERGAVHSVGDEGGYAPNLYTNKEAFKFMTEAIGRTPFKIKTDFLFGLDIVPDTFVKGGRYLIKDSPNPLTNDEFISYLEMLNNEYPMAYLEDGLADNDWEGWQKLTSRLAQQLTIVGDDLLAGNKSRLIEAIEKKACTGILVKPNQVGTITETFGLIKTAKEASLKVAISHRLGETTDTFIADLAVAVGADFIKFGAPVRGERVAKYNRLLQIESDLSK